MMQPLKDFAAGPVRVLVVDDDDALREGVCEILRASNYEVLEAGVPSEALALVQHSKPIHLLVTDFVLPHMNGRMLAAAAVAICPAMKVLFISGRLDDRKVYDSLQGIAYFLDKPFTPDDLLQAAQMTLSQTYGPDPVTAGR